MKFIIIFQVVPFSLGSGEEEGRPAVEVVGVVSNGGVLSEVRDRQRASHHPVHGPLETAISHHIISSGCLDVYHKSPDSGERWYKSRA